ncbi:MAM and LDL-receptor class A domain-containing protein 2-like 3 [Homarus americanus]|uniref:MAM and LDL-receptor class A domain-containing protein 2-like 3 n=1 Tax=Homarus americanus TaxID=6706 RepID=A0A8J5JWE9_HOMAM|nr:MAM and LDL-receptor class A domain-containing protein 2-like 3 [Homarus americanus]
MNMDSKGIHWNYNSEKHQMELEANGTDPLQYYVGQMRSPTFTTDSNSNTCLTLTWFFDTENEAHLTVIIQSADGLDIDFLMNVNDGSDGQWKTTNMDITKEGTFRIAIEGTVLSGWKGVMAFNNVLLVNKPCSEDVKTGSLWCDFESPEECGFHTSLPGDSTVWTWGSSDIPLDHTLDSPMGHTMYVDTDRKGSLAHLVTPSISPVDETFCLTFWFYMLGADVGRLTVYSMQNNNPGLPLLVNHQSYQKEWRGASVTGVVDISANFTVLFEAFTGEDNWGSLAIDDVKVTPGFCPNPSTCTFDDGLCLWTQSHTDDLDWEVVNSVGDLHDHTNKSGKFVTLRTGDPATIRNTAALESEPVELLEISCFTFWYNMWGENIGYLQIENSDPTFNEMILWQLTGPQTNASEWKYGSAPVSPAGTFNIISIVGEVNSIYETGNGTIAVDGVELKQGVNCDFEPPDAEVGTPAPMTTTPMPTPSPGYEGIGPVSDHTTGSGHYASSSRSPDLNYKTTVTSVLRSPKIMKTELSCFVFWYFLWGDNSKLILKVNNKNHWSRQGSQGNKWVPAKVNPKFKNNHGNLTLRAVLKQDHEYAYVALDDMFYYNVTCNKVDVGTNTGHQCDFEDEGLCGWIQVVEEDNADWDWVNGSQGVEGSDHSYGTASGHYLQLSSIKQGSGAHKMALLQLPLLKDMAVGDYCIQFYYARFGGVHTGNISVIVEFAGDITTIVEVNDRDGAKNWTLLQQTYTNLAADATFALVIRGDVGAASPNNGESVLAIDDYSFTNTGCPEPGSCTFEDAHLCMWHVEMSEDVSWQLTDGRESHSRGPHFDHTTNTSAGGYLILEDFDVHSGVVTDLVSSHIPNDVEGFCFSFFYSLSGDDGARLNVSSRTDDGTNTLWSLTGDQGPDWYYGQVGIAGSSSKGDFEIVIEGVTGSLAEGWIALDDLFTVMGECTILPPIATPTPIPVTTPLPPGDIFNCDFEMDICSMIQASSDDFDWVYHHSEDEFELPPGGYLLLDSNGHDPGNRAVITTPELTHKGLQCISFQFRFIGSEPGVLMLYFSVRETRSELEWEVQVHGEDSIILVDNIKVLSGGCPVQSNTCDFEYESDDDIYCGGYQSGKPTDFQFYRTYAAESAHKYGDEDHTYESAYGYYIVADFTKASEGGELATMDGPVVTESFECLTFWYQYSTPDTTLFRAICNGTEDEIFSVEVGTGSEWQLGAGFVPYYEGSVHVVFQSYFGGTPEGYVAIDDIKLHDTHYHCPVAGDCDFEEDTCGWTNTGDLEWVFSTLEDGEVGPLTFTNLMFVTPTDDLVGKTATLSSPVLPLVINCVQFWYKEVLDAPASLVAFLTRKSKMFGELSEIEFMAKRLEGSWSLGHNDGLTYLDDIDIDVFQTCTYVPPDAVPTTIPPTMSTAQPTVPPSIASCDFSDKTFCNWENIPGSVTWSIQNSSSNTHHVGPLMDHTTGDGYFMSLTPTSSKSKGVATVFSPELTPTETAGWLESYIGINTSRTFHIEFQGSQGDNPLANIAVDDILLIPAVCPENSGVLGNNTMSCTFEQGGTCGMYDDSLNGWALVVAATIPDHTTFTKQVAVEKTYGTVVSDKVILVKMGQPHWRAAQIPIYRFFGDKLMV